MNPPHLTVTQAGVTGLLVSIAGQLVAFVPSMAGYEQTLISGGSFLIAVAFLIANAIHHLASSKTPVVDPKTVQDEVGNVLRGIVAAGLSAGPPKPAVATPPAPAQTPPPAAGGLP